MPMQLTVNCEARAFEEPLTVADLLARIGMDARKVAIERNREVVPKSRYGATALAAGDRIEIVHFIGGGAPAAASESSRQTFQGDGDSPAAAVPVEEDTWRVAGRR